MFGILPEAQVALERIARFINDSELEELPAVYGSGEYRPPQTCALDWFSGRGGEQRA